MLVRKLRSVVRVFAFGASVLLIAGAIPGGVLARDRSDAPVPRPQGPLVWKLPVQRPVVDRFRPPATQWGAGNRGWEFATAEGDPVSAVGPGVVTYAGWVAGTGVVTLDHGGGLLSSVTGLAAVLVLRGQAVRAGDLLGRAREGLHLGFRQHGTYIDPALLYTRARHAVLVPVPGGV